jgi:hypothetical protein
MKHLYHFILLSSLICFTSFKVKAATYYLLTTATSCTNLASWTTDPTGLTAVGTPGSFTGAHTWEIQNVSSISLTNIWGLSSTATVDIGDGTTAISFTLTSAGKIGTGLLPITNFNNNSTFVLDRTYNLLAGRTNINTGSNFIYTSNAIANGVTDDYFNLTILDDTYLATDVLVNGDLTISSSKNLEITGSTLTLNGKILGTGNFNGYSPSSLILTGTGNIGTLNILSGGQLTDLTVNLGNSSSSVTLGTDLPIEAPGLFDLANGIFDINGKKLTINGGATFGAGVLKGSNTSSLSLVCVGAISGNLLMDQTNSATKSLYDLELNSSGNTLVIGNGLEILNSITPTAGTLNFNSNVTLKSTAALKARLGVVGGAVTGNLSVETFIPGGSAGWANLGPAGVSGLKVSNWDGGSGSATNFAMTCDGCTYGTDAAGGRHFVSIQSDPTGTETFVELVSSDDLVPGTGYWTFVGADLTSAIDVTQTNSGPAASGTITSAGRFVSNPYASPISLDLLKTHNTGLSSIDIWNADAGSYVSFNGGLPSTSTIPMGQGFYANGVSNVQFIETDKVSFNDASYSLLKTSSSIGNVVELDINAPNGDQDKTYIRFHGNATTSFDKDLDAYKRYVTPGYLGIPGPTYDKYTTIATLNANQDYAINSLPFAITADAIIPVKVKVSQTGTYTIQPIGVDAAIATGACLTLRDKLLNVTHDLKKGAYVVEINDTTLVARFELKVCADITAGINNLNQSTLSSLLIAQDQTGAYVETNFATKTKATISAYNVIGQKLMDDQEFEGTQTKVHLNLGQVNSQVVIIKVSTANESSVKKLFIN